MTYLTDTNINRINRSAIISCAVFFALNIFLRHSILERMFTTITMLVIVVSVPTALFILAVGYYAKHKGHILASFRVPDLRQRFMMAVKGAGFGAFFVWLVISMFWVAEHDGMLRAFVVGVMAFVFFLALLLVFLWALSVRWKTAPATLAKFVGSSLFTLRDLALIVFHRWAGTMSIVVAVLLWYSFGGNFFQWAREIDILTRALAAASLLIFVGAFIQAVCGSILRDRAVMYQIPFEPRRDYDTFRQELWYAFWRNAIWLTGVTVVIFVYYAVAILSYLLGFHG